MPQQRRISDPALAQGGRALVDPDNVAHVAAIDLVRWELSLLADFLGVTDYVAGRGVWVHGCESDGFKLQELAKQELPYGLPSDVVVCELHRGELSEPNTEWVRGPAHHWGCRFGHQSIRQ